MKHRGPWRIVAWLAACGVLAAVFLTYTQPSLMQQLGDAIWACF